MDLDNLLTQWPTDKDDLIEDMIKSRRYKSTIAKLLNEKVTLLDECQNIHDEITKLQHKSKTIQEKIRTVSTILNSLYNIQEESVEEIDKKETEVSSLDQPTIINDKPKTKKKESRAKKAKLIASIKDQLSPKSEKELHKERHRVQAEIKKYENVDFNALESIEQIIHPSFKSVRIMSNQVLKLKFDASSNKEFTRTISILRYLQNCDLTPRLLNWNVEKRILYLPYYGELLKKDGSRKLSILLRKLKRNWGVYLVKDGQVQNSLSTNAAMIDSNDRIWIFDFTSPYWVVDREQTYPMVN